jgi:hypothetical protein
MNKYFVVVNQKYIVSVESSSNAGAEHEILDNIKRTKSALAFGQEEINTATFFDYLTTCTTVSFEELKRKDNEATARDMKRINDYYDSELAMQLAIDNTRAEIINLEKELALKNVYLTCHINELEELAKERHDYAEKVQLDDQYYSQSEIDERITA